MKFRLMILLACAFLLANCSASPTPQPTSVAPATASPVPTNSPTALPTATPNLFGLNIVAQYDATSQILTIYGITPAATVVLGGTPLLPPPTATATNTLAPTNTPAPTGTPRPVVVVPRPTAVPPAPVTAAALRGKIMFKTARDGGIYPSVFAYYVMNPDGSGLRRLDLNAATALAIQLSSESTGVENLEPGGAHRVFGDRHCYGYGTCSIYILDTVINADQINSSEDISVGAFFSQSGFIAKSPAWSPAGNYIAFVFNNAGSIPTKQGCLRTNNIFKAAPTTNSKKVPLTGFCSGSNGDHPSFSPDGSRLTFWSEDSGMRQIYVVDVGGDDTFGFPASNPQMISDHRSDDWDPLWVK